MQNILKRKNMYFYEKKWEIWSFGPVNYVLAYSESFDMHVEKLWKKNIFFFSKVCQKPAFVVRAVHRTLQTSPKLFLRLPFNLNLKSLKVKIQSSLLILYLYYLVLIIQWIIPKKQISICTN